MFAESAWTRKTIGDVDVVYHEGLYHLFHLVLPNHDFIAHAISDNALNWRRVDNALFIGNPGTWDDLMLWTVHVSPNPHQAGWRMFYTGISRRDQGLKQRVGLAVSDDLYTWRKAAVNWLDTRGPTDPTLVKAARAKLPRGRSDCIQSMHDPTSSFPLKADPRYYESSIDSDRQWVSFRDPFYYREGDRGWLLVAGRVNHGPLVRRGCVAVMEETSINHFTALPPLHHPRQYDDIEVPNLMKIEQDYYLIGSLREDAKIRYWHTTKIGEPWVNFYDNVLLPKGNYAGRICRDDKGLLLWNFFTGDTTDRTVNNIMPPPKRLWRRDNGQLKAGTFEGIEARANGSIDSRCVAALKEEEAEVHCRIGHGSLVLATRGGLQAFVFDHPVDCFRLRAKLLVTGSGKCGLVVRLDPQTHDGYYISLDLMKGIAQIRAWGTGALRSGEKMMQFKTLQAGNWYSALTNDVQIQLIAFGSYHELSINGNVILSLADSTYTEGRLGFYVESAELRVDQLTIDKLDPPTQSDDHLTTG